MKLGIAVDWAGATITVPREKILLAEKLGYDSVWTAEAYGSDAITPLAYIASFTKRIRLATSVIQVAARSAAATAMSMNTLDALAGGNRVIAGLGLSGPQIVEGWYGQPWGKPYWKLRDYVQIMRKILKREEYVSHDGREISLPYQGPGAVGLGKPLKSILHTNPAIPIWLGTGGQANVTLTAEVADGWIPFGFVPGSLETYRPWLEEGFRRAGNGKSFADFEIQAGVNVCIGDDVKAAINNQKPIVALYVGGMGAKNMNFHKDMMVRRGYPEAAQRIQELFLAGRRDEAVAAVPDDYIDEGALFGPVDRIRKRLYEWQSSGVTGLTLYGVDEEGMKTIADIVNGFN